MCDRSDYIIMTYMRGSRKRAPRSTFLQCVPFRYRTNRRPPASVRVRLFLVRVSVKNGGEGQEQGESMAHTTEQTIEQLTEQTIEQTTEQTIEETIEQNIEQTTGQTIGQTTARTIELEAQWF